MEGVISIRADVKECFDFFHGLDVNHKTIRSYIMRSVATGAKRAVKRGYGETLHRRSGTLYKSITAKVKAYGTKVYVSNNADSGKPTAKDGRTARYGFMLASGYTIEAKTAKGLKFNINGKWITKHSVTVQPKDWVEPSVQRYVDSSEFDTAVDKAFQNQIDYWEKRLAKGSI